jgi:hypothetical protein
VGADPPVRIPNLDLGRAAGVSSGSGKVISTRDLSRLPDVHGLRLLLQAMATLDAILCPEWQYRYYSFNCAWADGQEMGSMRNGSGDDFFAHFSSAGCWLKGFAHESVMSPYAHEPKRVWPGILDGVPVEFAACLREPAFTAEDATFCIWRGNADSSWKTGRITFPPEVDDPDGSEFLLSALDGRPETYQSYAGEYFEKEADVALVSHVYQHRPLTQEIVASLNPQLSLAELAGDLKEIGYPSVTAPE